MKKVLFLIVTLVCAVTGAWADAVVTDDGKTLTITTSAPGAVSNMVSSLQNKGDITKIVLDGDFNAADLNALSSNSGFTSVTTVDMKSAQFPKAGTSNIILLHNNPTNAGNSNTDYIVGGTMYKGKKANEFVIEEVSASATSNWNFRADWYSYQVQQNIDKNNEGWYKVAKDVYYQKSNGSWTKVTGSIPSNANPRDWNQNDVESGNKNNEGGDGEYVVIHSATDFNYYHGYPKYVWEETAYNDNEQVNKGHFSSLDDAPNATNENDKIVVGGTTWVYESNKWSIASGNTNWGAIKFNYWKGTLTTAILPGDANPAECPESVLNECTHLTLVKSGDQSQYSAEISYNTTTKIATVRSAQAGGLFRLLYKATQSNYTQNNSGETTTFQFTSNCTALNADDIAVLAFSDGKYYVDLYDVPTGEGTTIEDALLTSKNEGETDADYNSRANGAINQMRNANTQFRGLLLPKNPQRVGTTLIMDVTQGSSAKATCSECIAYNNNTSTAMYIYRDGNNDPSYQSRYNALKAMMDRHDAIATNTTSYGIATNSSAKIAELNLPESATQVLTTNNDIVKGNSEDTKASIFVHMVQAGGFYTLVDGTNTQQTPTETIEIDGPVSLNDITAINHFTDGPTVIDLKDATGVNKSTIQQLSDVPELEYLILPAGLTKDDVCDEDNYYNTVENEGTTTKVKKLPKLKAVISSNSTNLVAYVAEAGSLISARSMATGSNGSNPAAVGLTTVTLGGNLNATDIAAGGSTGGLKGEGNTITSIDLEYAYFATAADMKLGDNGGAALKSLRDVKLPTDPRMEVIPAECFHNVGTLQSIHIPYNYKEIKARAFEGTAPLSHITTEDANHSLIDNGPNTYTFSANISVLGEKKQDNYVFPEGAYVTDVYCLAMKTPKCYLQTFPPNMVYANGGIYAGPYCRDKYIDYKDGQPKNAVTLLHFPSQESFNNATNKETVEEGDPYGTDAYKKMVMKYTDPERDYHKKDQTGAVDANGNPLKWPDQGEVLKTRDMAVAGHIWTDYPNITYQVGGTAHLTGIGEPVGSTQPFYPDYVGWHEFVLTQATYVKPDEHVVEDVVYNYYKDAGWYTFCIPFDLSYNDVVKMLGVPKSTDKEKSYIVENGVARETEETDDVMPDIRQLESVERKKGVGSENNEIVFRLTTDLADKGNKTANYLDFSEDSQNGKWTPSKSSAKKDGETDDPTCMVGGRPYIIKAYKRVYKNGESFVEETIPSQNIGLYIMKHYADDFKESASCLNNKGYYEQLNYFEYELADGKYSVKSTVPGGETMKFAKPYENHKVQAVDGGSDAGELTFTEEGKKPKRYFYTMVGQFWDQSLPQYSVYMSNGKWYRYTDPSRNYKWARYKCVIMATPEVDEDDIKDLTEADLHDADELMDEIWTNNGAPKPILPKTPVASLKPGGNFRDFKNCFFPMNMPGTIDLISGPMKLVFFGRNDHDFNVPGHHHIGFPAPTRYVFVLDGDEDVVEYDENGNAVTAIATLDGEVQSTAGTSKVYNLSGQYVGNSTEGLSKGIYIVDGRKIVVD